MFKLESERIRIRNLYEKDRNDFYSYRSIPEVCQYQGFNVMNIEECHSFIIDQKEKVFGKAGQWVQYAIESKESSTLIGDCAIKLTENEPRIAEIGITLNPKYQKKGFAKEAVTCILNFLFLEKNVHRVQVSLDVNNEGSINLLKALNFVYEGHFRENYFENGKWGSEFMYSMLVAEWKGRNDE